MISVKLYILYYVICIQFYKSIYTYRQIPSKFDIYFTLGEYNVNPVYMLSTHPKQTLCLDLLKQILYSKGNLYIIEKKKIHIMLNLYSIYVIVIIII